jgi:hypothetical protein
MASFGQLHTMGPEPVSDPDSDKQAVSAHVEAASVASSIRIRG